MVGTYSLRFASFFYFGTFWVTSHDHTKVGNYESCTQTISCHAIQWTIEITRYGVSARVSGESTNLHSIVSGCGGVGCSAGAHDHVVCCGADARERRAGRGTAAAALHGGAVAAARRRLAQARSRAAGPAPPGTALPRPTAPLPALYLLIH